MKSLVLVMRGVKGLHTRQRLASGSWSVRSCSRVGEIFELGRGLRTLLADSLADGAYS